MIEVQPAQALRGSTRIPFSKPHCQRILLMASLARGKSCVHNIDMNAETRIIADACLSFGASIEQKGDTLYIEGMDGRLRRPEHILHVDNSGFALRTLLSIASLANGPTILTGDEKLGQRPVLPLREQLGMCGVKIEAIDRSRHFPLVNWGEGLRGGDVSVPMDSTSQLATALLLVAPYAQDEMELELCGEMVGREYIRLNIMLMREFGVKVEAQGDLRKIRVWRGGYRGREISIGLDGNALFYFIAAAVIVDTDIVVEGLIPEEDTFLERILDIGRMCGVRIMVSDEGIRIRSGEPPTEQIELHVADVPTLVPAIASLACSLPYGIKVTGAQHVRFHKTSRLSLLLTELMKLGGSFTPIYKDDVLDGFEAQFVERAGEKGDITLDSHGDHRLFMALYLASLGLRRPSHLIGEEMLVMSFPTFLSAFAELKTVLKKSVY